MLSELTAVRITDTGIVLSDGNAQDSPINTNSGVKITDLILPANSNFFDEPIETRSANYDSPGYPNSSGMGNKLTVENQGVHQSSPPLTWVPGGQIVKWHYNATKESDNQSIDENSVSALANIIKAHNSNLAYTSTKLANITFDYRGAFKDPHDTYMESSDQHSVLSLYAKREITDIAVTVNATSPDAGNTDISNGTVTKSGGNWIVNTDTNASGNITLAFTVTSEYDNNAADTTISQENWDVSCGSEFGSVTTTSGANPQVTFAANIAHGLSTTVTFTHATGFSTTQTIEIENNTCDWGRWADGITIYDTDDHAHDADITFEICSTLMLVDNPISEDIVDPTSGLAVRDNVGTGYYLGGAYGDGVNPTAYSIIITHDGSGLGPASFTLSSDSLGVEDPEYPFALMPGNHQLSSGEYPPVIQLINKEITPQAEAYVNTYRMALTLCGGTSSELEVITSNSKTITTTVQDCSCAEVDWDNFTIGFSNDPDSAIMLCAPDTAGVIELEALVDIDLGVLQVQSANVNDGAWQNITSEANNWPAGGEGAIIQISAPEGAGNLIEAGNLGGSTTNGAVVLANQSIYSPGTYTFDVEYTANICGEMQMATTTFDIVVMDCTPPQVTLDVLYRIAATTSLIQFRLGGLGESFSLVSASGGAAEDASAIIEEAFGSIIQVHIPDGADGSLCIAASDGPELLTRLTIQPNSSDWYGTMIIDDGELLAHDCMDYPNGAVYQDTAITTEDTNGSDKLEQDTIVLLGYQEGFDPGNGCPNGQYWNNDALGTGIGACVPIGWELGDDIGDFGGDIVIDPPSDKDLKNILGVVAAEDVTTDYHLIGLATFEYEWNAIAKALFGLEGHVAEGFLAEQLESLYPAPDPANPPTSKDDGHIWWHEYMTDEQKALHENVHNFYTFFNSALLEAEIAAAKEALDSE